MRGAFIAACGLGAVLLPLPASAGPEAFRAGQQMCAKLAQHYAPQYQQFAQISPNDREKVFENVKTRQENERMQDAADGKDSSATYITGVVHFVERTVVLLSIENSGMSEAEVRGSLFDQCSQQARGLLDLPGR